MGLGTGDSSGHQTIPPIHPQYFFQAVLQCPYDFEKGRQIVREMTELPMLDLVRKHVGTKQIVLDIGHNHESLEGERGRRNMAGYTSSIHAIIAAVLDVYDRVIHNDLLILCTISCYPPK